jgi:plasmid stability protein
VPANPTEAALRAALAMYQAPPVRWQLRRVSMMISRLHRSVVVFVEPMKSRSEIDMLLACAHANSMSRMVQIRNVPDTLHRKLKARAADSGQTLSDYLLAELERLAARPTREEMRARLHSRKRVTLKTPAAVVIREERDSA